MGFAVATFLACSLRCATGAVTVQKVSDTANLPGNLPKRSKADVFAAALGGGNRGFADADLESDESMKMIKHGALRHQHAGHRAVLPRSDAGKEDAHARAIQSEVESMIHRVKLLGDKDAFAFVKELDEIEGSLASNSEDKGLVQEISTVRADLCAHRGFKGTEEEECEAFMHKACVIDGIGNSDSEPTVPDEDCLTFYSMGGMDAATTSRLAGAPAPAVAAGPSAAAAPSAAAPVAPAAASEEPAGWSMKERPLPDQGFTGQLEEHDDMSTATADWRREFGPKSGHGSFKSICAQYPKNEWCRLHGFFRTESNVASAPPERAGAVRQSALGFVAFVVLQALL